jgi:HPt (histidine-containing phosphotransfer) domain-containing protein
VSDSARPLALHSVFPGVPTLNQGRLEMIAKDASHEFLVELAELFVADVEERISWLVTIVGSRDAAKIADAAHRVQSAASSLGVMRLRSLAASLEKHAEGADWSRVEAALGRVQKEFLHVKEVLAAMRRGDARPLDLTTADSPRR